MAHREGIAAPDSNASVISKRHTVLRSRRDRNNVCRVRRNVGLAGTVAAPRDDASIFEQGEYVRAAGADNFHVAKTGRNIGLTAAIQSPCGDRDSLTNGYNGNQIGSRAKIVIYDHR